MTKMTPQEVFTKSVEGIMKQGCPSMNGEMCAYRGKSPSGGEGMMCAVGQVLKDEDYHPILDNKTVNGERVEEHLLVDTRIINLINNKKVPDYISEHRDLLDALQYAHDSYANDYILDAQMWMEGFRKECRNIARKYKLKMPVGLYKRNYEKALKDMKHA